MFGATVEGKQYVDDRVERWIFLYAVNAVKLSAADAGRLAGMLQLAANRLDKYK